MIIAASLLAIDGAAVVWIATTRSHVDGIGNGDFRNYSIIGDAYDGSRVHIIQNSLTGTERRILLRPATVAGRCRVWWPAPAAGCITLIVLALALTRAGHLYVAELSLPRITMRWFMIAVVVLGAEAGWILRMMDSSQWSLMQLDYFILHGVALIAVLTAVLFLFVRRHLCSR